MKERPILFSAPMVRAILDGSKTQTRRIVKPEHVSACHDGVPALFKRFPYGKPGDRLWVRETWGNNPEGPGYVYRADGDFDMKFHGDRWRPSIHMPRWASRITLEVVSVRVERLQDISEDDVKAEGIEWVIGYHSRIPLFEQLWERINGPGSWDANPWVWCVNLMAIKS